MPDDEEHPQTGGSGDRPPDEEADKNAPEADEAEADNGRPTTLIRAGHSNQPINALDSPRQSANGSIPRALLVELDRRKMASDEGKDGLDQGRLPGHSVKEFSCEVDSHGVVRYTWYVEQCLEGQIRPWWVVPVRWRSSIAA